MPLGSSSAAPVINPGPSLDHNVIFMGSVAVADLSGRGYNGAWRVSFHNSNQESAMNAGDVLTLTGESSVLDAARTMLRHRVSGMPVIDWSCKLIGMLTEGDLLRRTE